MARSLISVSDFIENLRSFEQQIITRDSVLDFCSTVQVSDSSLDPFIHFDDNIYTRNLVLIERNRKSGNPA